jgi:hypothetical protein
MRAPNRSLRPYGSFSMCKRMRVREIYSTKEHELDHGGDGLSLLKVIDWLQPGRDELAKIQSVLIPVSILQADIITRCLTKCSVK